MPDEPTVASLDDISRDLEATDLARGRLVDFFAREADAVRAWGHRRSTRAGAPPGAGRGLIVRCPADTRRRYDSLLYFEEKARQEDDYSLFIAAACQIVEAEIDRLLTVPAYGIAASLVSALRHQAEDGKQAEILERWAANKIPTTFGVHVTVLLALRRGCERGDRPVTEFLAESFQPRYVNLLTSKKLGACLDQVRGEFRNPACHGTTAFDEPGYERFVRLVLAQRRFAAWDALGPTPPEPGAEVGVFHHHLSLSRRLGPAPDEESPRIGPGLAALRAMARHTARIWPVPFDGSRGLGGPPPGVECAIRLGSQICLAVEPERAGHLLLLDEGPEGTVYCLCPSWFAPDTHLHPGRSYVPQAGSRYPSLGVSGRPGREQLLAIITDEPLGLDWTPPDPKVPARVLDAADIEALLSKLRGLEGNRWTVLSTSFEVLP